MYNVVTNWGAFPGTMFKAGLSGRFAIGDNPVIIRIRAGGRPTVNNVSTDVTGTIVYQVTLPANATTDLGDVGALFPLPSGSMVYSNLALTSQPVGGASSISTTSTVI